MRHSAYNKFRDIYQAKRSHQETAARLPRSGCGLQPNVAAPSGYVGSKAPSIIQPQSGCALVPTKAATASRLMFQLTLSLPNVAAKRGNVGLEVATASR